MRRLYEDKNQCSNARLRSIHLGMIAKGVKPTSVSCCAVLGACSHAVLVTDAKELFKSMIRKYDKSLSVECLEK
ncbi:hypothetical protein AKJ16_DCAP23659 [Drosera capensis]